MEDMPLSIRLYTQQCWFLHYQYTQSKQFLQPFILLANDYHNIFEHSFDYSPPFSQMLGLFLNNSNNFDYNRSISYMQLLLALTIITSLLLQSQQLLFNSQLNNPTARFSSISEAYLSLSGQSLLLLSKKDNSQAAQILDLSLANGTLVVENSYESGLDFSSYWQIYRLEKEIMSFAISISETAEFYTSPPQPSITTSYNEIFFRGVWLTTKKLAYLSTVRGTIAYANKDGLQSKRFTFLENSHHLGSTFLSLSPDQRYLCSSDIFTGLVSIWSIEQQKIQVELWLNQSGIRTHTWSDDSSLLFVFGYQSGAIYIFDAENGFTRSQMYSTPAIMAIACFYYYETNEIAVLSANTSQLIVVDLQSSTSISYNVGIESPIKLKVDKTRHFFVIFNYTDLVYFKIQSFCNDSQFYDVSTATCNNCSVGCLTCGQFYCFECQTNYYLNDSQLCVMTPVQTSEKPSGFAQDISKATFNVINKTITVPGHRQFLSVFFSLFSNFDHFLLYIYHNREYGPNMEFILKQIHDTIDYRFQVISDRVCKEDLGLDFNRIEEIIDYKANYSIPTFVGIQENGQGFFQTNIQYFLLNIPLILLTLFCYRLAFRLLFNYRISIFLRKFTFWGIIILLLLQGNIELFFFSFTGDYLISFSTNVQHKYLNAATLVAGFCTLLLATLGYYALYILHRRRSAYFYQNCKGKFASALFFTIVNGVFNIIRGIIHRSAITEPTLQAFLLFALEGSQVVLMIYSWRKLQIFQSKFVALLFLSGSFSRALFNISLLSSSLIPIDILDMIHIVIFLFNVLTFLLAILENIYDVVTKVKRICSNKVRNFKKPTRGKRSQISNIFDRRKMRLERSQRSRDSKSSGVEKIWILKNNVITFKICRKQGVKALTVKAQDQSSEKERNKDLESINLQ